jgi:hypothetical protein
VKEIGIALVSETERLSARELKRVAAVLQKQLERDAGPIWNVAARVDPFSSARDVPKDHWPVGVRDRVDAAGMWSVHSVEDDRPFAQVTYDQSWPLWASHELLEMLTDPELNRTAHARSIVPGEKRQVEYLVQVCDPCAGPDNGYTIDDVLVADFTTPAYWTGSRKKGVKYSFTGAVKKPLEVLRGGYLSWRDPETKHWRQKVWWREKPEYQDLGAFETEQSEGAETGSVRAATAVRIQFQMAMLREFHRAQEPRLQSIRTTVEDLIRSFG